MSEKNGKEKEGKANERESVISPYFKLRRLGCFSLPLLFAGGGKKGVV